MKKRHYEIKEVVFELIEDQDDEIFCNIVCAEVFYPAILGRAVTCKMEREWYGDTYIKSYNFYDKDGKHIATQTLNYDDVVEEDEEN